MYLVHIESMQGLTALGIHSPACHKSENSWFLPLYEEFHPYRILDEVKH